MVKMTGAKLMNNKFHLKINSLHLFFKNYPKNTPLI